MIPSLDCLETVVGPLFFVCWLPISLAHLGAHHHLLLRANGLVNLVQNVGACNNFLDLFHVRPLKKAVVIMRLLILFLAAASSSIIISGEALSLLHFTAASTIKQRRRPKRGRGHGAAVDDH